MQPLRKALPSFTSKLPGLGDTCWVESSHSLAGYTCTRQMGDNPHPTTPAGLPTLLDTGLPLT